MTARRFQHHFGARRLPSAAAHDWKRGRCRSSCRGSRPAPGLGGVCVGRSFRAAEAAERARLSGTRRRTDPSVALSWQPQEFSLQRAALPPWRATLKKESGGAGGATSCQMCCQAAALHHCCRLPHERSRSNAYRQRGLMNGRPDARGFADASFRPRGPRPASHAVSRAPRCPIGFRAGCDRGAGLRVQTSARSPGLTSQRSCIHLF